jgi:hypothetical protein
MQQFGTGIRDKKELQRNMKPNEHTATAAVVGCPIATAGEVFVDGAMIELVGGVHPAHPQLMLWDGSKEIVAPVVEYNGQWYEPAEIESSVLQHLALPTRCCPHGTTREFLMETCTLIANLVALDEKSAFLAARIVLCSAIIDAVSVAPVLVVAGPDTARANRLVSVLRCLCRHSVPLTSVTPASFCSLASSARYTFLISQASVSDKLQKLLDDASRSDRKIPFRGRLLDLFGVQVIQSDSFRAGESSPRRSIQISMIPTDRELPIFDLDAQRQIMGEFQSKLVSFRRVNLGAARRLQFDASQFTFAIRELAHSLAAATPDDAELQAEVFEMLREEDAEIRSGRWTDYSVVAAEAVLVAYKESPGGMIYVSDLANFAEVILARRSEESKFDPGKFGKQLKLLGFTTEPRDAKGKKLHLTEAVRGRAMQLLHDFGGSESADVEPVRTDWQSR